MKKILNKLRKNKLLVLFSILFLLLIAFCVKVIIIFTESDEVAIYGTRLEGIDKVVINEKDMSKKIIEKLGEDIDNIDFRTQGRLINIIINVKGNISRDAAKEDAKKTIEEFSDDEKKYYDIQIFVNKKEQTEDSKQFPIIGYKHHERSDISWTKDRTGNDE